MPRDFMEHRASNLAASGGGEHFGSSGRIQRQRRCQTGPISQGEGEGTMPPLQRVQTAPELFSMQRGLAPQPTASRAIVRPNASTGREVVPQREPSQAPRLSNSQEDPELMLRTEVSYAVEVPFTQASSVYSQGSSDYSQTESGMRLRGAISTTDSTREVFDNFDGVHTHGLAAVDLHTLSDSPVVPGTPGTIQWAESPLGGPIRRMDAYSIYRRPSTQALTQGSVGYFDVSSASSLDASNVNAGADDPRKDERWLTGPRNPEGKMRSLGRKMSKIFLRRRSKSTDGL